MAVRNIVRQYGQSLTECLLVLAITALAAVIGASVVTTGAGVQASAMADAIAGGSPKTEQRLPAVLTSGALQLTEFDPGFARSSPGSANGRPGGSAAGPDQSNSGSVALLQGIAAGLFDTLWEELNALLSPLETASALAELSRLLIADPAATVALLYDELIASQIAQLIEGSDYERGFVLGSQASPLKAVSILAKATGAAALVGAVRKIEDAEGLRRVNGRKPINSQYAGRVHPSGVRFSKEGFPDFSPYSKAEVKLDNLTGDYYQDMRRANAAVGLDTTPDGFVWHHVEDGQTMQLVPKDIHRAARHTGGAAIIRSDGANGDRG